MQCVHKFRVSSVPVGLGCISPRRRKDHVPGNGSGETKRVFILPTPFATSFFILYLLFSISFSYFLFSFQTLPFLSYIFSTPPFNFRAFGTPVCFVHRGLCGHYDLLSLCYSPSPYQGPFEPHDLDRLPNKNLSFD